MEKLISSKASTLLNSQTVLVLTQLLTASNKVFLIQDAVDSNGENHGEKKTQGTTPLFIAAQHNHKDMVKFLTKAKNNERTSDMNGVTPLMIAIKEGNIDIVKDLLDAESVQELSLIHI